MLQGVMIHVASYLIFAMESLGVQWNLSNTDTLGAIKCVLIREVSSLQGCPLRGVPLYTG